MVELAGSSAEGAGITEKARPAFSRSAHPEADRPHTLHGPPGRRGILVHCNFEALKVAFQFCIIQMPMRGPSASLPSITLLPPPPFSTKCYINKGAHMCPASAPLELALFHSQNNCMYSAKAVHDSHCPHKITGICSLSGQADS